MIMIVVIVMIITMIIIITIIMFASTGPDRNEGVKMRPMKCYLPRSTLMILPDGLINRAEVNLLAHTAARYITFK